MTIFTNKFLKYFNNRYHQTYDELYDGMDTKLIGEKSWYDALDRFDKGLNSVEKGLLNDFISYRRDFVTSDREAVAFVLSLNCIKAYFDKEYEAQLKKQSESTESRK